MQYKDVVREMFKKHPNKAPKDVMRMAAAQWKTIKNKGGALSHSIKKTRGGGVSGGSIIGDVGHGAVDIADKLGDLFGLGLQHKGKSRKGRKVRGAGVSGGGASGGSLLDLFGLGLDNPRGGGVSGGSIIGDVGHGAVDVADKLGDLFGLGLQHKGKSRKGRKVRGAGVSGGGASGGSLLDLFGLGLDKPKHTKGGSLLDLFGLGLDKPRGGYVSAGDMSDNSYSRNPSIGTVQPFQPSLTNDMTRGGNILNSALHALPFMALL
jgi:hypothetical protein